MNNGKYQAHEGHTGQIKGTRISPHHVYYRVACECGKNISPAASEMVFVTTPHDDPNPQSVQEIRMDYFLRQVGVEPQRDTMEQQVKDSLATVRNMRDGKIMTQRFGLDGSEGKTLQEIGDGYGITRARVQQIEARVLQTIRRALEEVVANA